MNRRLRRLHRWFGLLVALFGMELAITGISLNHSEQLDLDGIPVQSLPLLSWYGIKPPEHIRAYLANGHWVSQWGQQLYLDSHALPNPPTKPLLGAVGVQNLIALAWEDRVWLITDSGQLAMSWNGESDIPQPVEAIASDGARLWLKSGNVLLVTDDNLLNWMAAANDTLTWAESSHLPSAVRDTITPLYLGRSLSWERLILDLHSGRLFGQLGPWIVDAAAILIMLLAMSGVWMWLLGQRRRKGS